MSAPTRPLLYLVQAERKVKCVEPRDFAAEPWMLGEGIRFWTVERIAQLKQANEQLRAERKRRQ